MQVHAAQASVDSAALVTIAANAVQQTLFIFADMAPSFQRKQYQ